MQGAGDQYPLGFGLTVGAHRHQQRLGQRRSTVVQRGIGHGQAGQARHHALIFVQHLQGALTGLRLVGRVGAVEFATTDDLPHRRRDVMLVGAGAQEAQRAGIIRRSRFHQPGDLQLVQRLREGR